MKRFLFSVCLLVGVSAGAQYDTALGIQGKITGRPVNGVFKGVTVKTFNHIYEKMLEAAMATKALSAPVGFDVAIFANSPKYQPQLGDKRHIGSFDIFLFNYFMDNQGVATKVAESSAIIRAYINPADFFTEDAGYFERTNEPLGLPHFFQKIPLTDSTEDYVEYCFKNYPYPHQGGYGDFAIRIIGRDHKPLFVPFTRKEYMQYLLAENKHMISDCQKDIDTRKAEVAKQQNDLNDKTSPEEYRKLIPKLLAIGKAQISAASENIDSLQKTGAVIEAALHAAASDELQSVAYVDVQSTRYYKKDLQFLVPYGQPGGESLYKVNPDYYNNSLPSEAVQSIMVTYWYGQFCPGFLRTRIKEIFDHMDYRLIKENMH